MGTIHPVHECPSTIIHTTTDDERQALCRPHTPQIDLHPRDETIANPNIRDHTLTARRLRPAITTTTTPAVEVLSLATLEEKVGENQSIVDTGHLTAMAIP
ncbi:hypothetical protein HDV00_010311 [Rhizophlyctis rosea]|nr:hypothetical protein HDV00_010311 [Rhizophlyctis rosea]